MDGRWVRKLTISGCIVLGCAGCNRNTVQTTDAQPITGVSSADASAKPWWGSSTPQQNELVMEAPKKGPPKAETDVAFAEVYMAKALDEKTQDSERNGAFDTARVLYQKALKQEPKNQPALLGLARYYARVGERDKSIDTYQKCLAAHSGDREVTHEVAVWFARWQDWGNSALWYDRALKIDPENITIRKEKAFLLAHAGQWDAALDVFRTIMPEAQARYNIARVLNGQNLVDASRQQLAFALQADPNAGDARDFLAELDRASQPAAAADPNAIQKAGYVPEQ